jgi:Zn-dependent protease with chaperone function
MVEKILMTLLAVIILVFFLTMGGSGLLGKPESGKRAIPLPVGIALFVVGAVFYLALAWGVLIHVYRR